jgi:hypothetical protein
MRIIVGARVEEILELVDREFKKIHRSKKFRAALRLLAVPPNCRDWLNFQKKC